MKKQALFFSLLLIAFTACDRNKTLTYDLGPATVDYPSDYEIKDVDVDEDGTFEFTCEAKNNDIVSNIEVEVYPNMDLQENLDERRDLLSTFTQSGLGDYFDTFDAILENSGYEGSIEEVVADQFSDDDNTCMVYITALFGGEKIFARIEASYVDDWKSVVYAVYESSEGEEDLKKLRNVLTGIKLK